MVSINDNSALLLYRVGPILCCSPCLPVSAIIVPEHLTRPPGSNPGRPGIFKHANFIVRELDLRVQFGVDNSAWTNPGHIIVTTAGQDHIGFHVDAIEDVIKLPSSGWGNLPALLPRGIFNRTLLHKEKIYLYAEFAELQHIPHSGYLRPYIEQMPTPASNSTATPSKQPLPTKSDSSTTTSAQASPSLPAVPKQQTPAPPDSSRPLQTATPNTTATNKTTKPTTSLSSPTGAVRTPPKRESSPLLSSVDSGNKNPTVASTVHHHRSLNVTASAENKTLTSTPAHTQPQQNTRQINHNDNSHHTFTGLFILLALLGLLGIGLWYTFDDTGLFNKPEQSTTVINSTNTLSTTTNNMKTPATTTKIHTADQHTQSKPAVNNSVLADSAKPEQVENNSIADTSPLKAEANTNASSKQSNSNNYHASIKQDKSEITITVDVPPVPSNSNSKLENTSPQKLNTRNETPTKTHTPLQHNANANLKPGPEHISKQTSRLRTRVIIHIVVKGDTLWAIAKKYVHDPFRYPELARLSKIHNPDLIYPGERVRIIKRIHQNN